MTNKQIAQQRIEFFLKSLTPESIKVIERENKIDFDTRNQELNTRLQIYEIKEFKLYLGIVKHNGQIIKKIASGTQLWMILNAETHLKLN